MELFAMYVYFPNREYETSELFIMTFLPSKEQPLRTIEPEPILTSKQTLAIVLNTALSKKSGKINLIIRKTFTTRNSPYLNCIKCKQIVCHR